MEGVDGLDDRLPVVAGRRGQSERDPTGVDDDRDSVVLGHLFGQHPQTRLHQGQFIRRLHRAGHVDHEHQVRRLAVLKPDFLALQANADEVVIGVPGAARDLGVDRERDVAVGAGVVVGEVVDHLLDADGVGRRQQALVEEPSDVGVRGGVDVDREGGEGVGGGDGLEVVLDEGGVLLGVGWFDGGAGRLLGGFDLLELLLQLHLRQVAGILVPAGVRNHEREQSVRFGL